MNRSTAPASATGPRPSGAGAGSEADGPDEAAPRPARAPWVRPAVLVALLSALGTWAAFGGADLLGELRQWIDSLGLWGPVIFAVCYALAVTALLPGSVLTASAGALFGLSLGTGVVLVGATAGAALSFGIARWLGRPVVARYAGSGRLARLDAYLTRHGFTAVLVVRLVPLFPFSVINYGAGVAGVRFSSYVTATALGIVPGTVVYTGLGGSLGDPASPGLWIALGALLVLSAGGWWAARLVRSRSTEISTAPAAHGRQAARPDPRPGEDGGHQPGVAATLSPSGTPRERARRHAPPAQSGGHSLLPGTRPDHVPADEE